MGARTCLHWAAMKFRRPVIRSENERHRVGGPAKAAYANSYDRYTLAYWFLD